ncbi:hypothetical protein J2T02_005664 [Chitinophaga terrae (ex Kim and Jung 2007)]|nr:hypothetical protein [Chitinophaga terrae (ex Kim and Jung 2007)]
MLLIVPETPDTHGYNTYLSEAPKVSSCIYHLAGFKILRTHIKQNQ